MKKLFFAASFVVFTLTSLISTPPAYADSVAQRVCEYVAADDKKRMRSYLKTNKLKIRNIFSGVKCNGVNLIEFAASKNAIETGRLMISKLPKKVVSAQLANIQNGAQALIDAANARVSS